MTTYIENSQSRPWAVKRDRKFHWKFMLRPKPPEVYAKALEVYAKPREVIARAPGVYAKSLQVYAKTLEVHAKSPKVYALHFPELLFTFQLVKDVWRCFRLYPC